jgi:LPS sulfotransferase NodH
MSRSRFCLVTTARSGSTFLCELLDSVPGVICQGELFHKRSIHQARRHRLDLQTSLEERDRDPVGFLHQLEATAFERWPEIVTSGFKLFPTHNATVLRHVVAEADYQIVFLRRTNLLAQFSSNLLAKQAGRWARRDPHPRFEEGVIRFDADEFQAFVAGQNRAFDDVTRHLEWRNAESVTITFDEIKSEGAIRRVLRHLGVDYDGDLSVLMEGVSVVRENQPNIIDRFSNPTDVAVAMRALGREEWLGSEFASDSSAHNRRGVEHAGDALRPVVSTVFRGARFSTNRWGMRDKDYEKTPPPATCRMAVLGPAFVMGPGVNDGEPFEQVVEDQLNRDLSPQTGLTYECLNFGISEYSLVQQASLLESAWVGQFRPHTVLLVAHPISDVLAVLRYVRKNAFHGDDLAHSVKSLVQKAGVLPDMSEKEGQRLLRPFVGDLLRWTLARAAAAIRDMGARPALVLIPEPADPLDSPRWPLFLSAARDTGLPVIDIHDVFEGQDPAQLTLSAADSGPNAKGHRLIAARLYAELIRRADLLTAADEETTTASDRAHAAWTAAVAARRTMDVWRKRWRVETHQGSEADMTHSPDELGRMRVSIYQLPLHVAWHVKLRVAPIPIRKDDQYLLTFRVRADAVRGVGWGVEQDVRPWGSLGLYEANEVTPSWQTFTCAFTATGTEPVARVFFDLGSSSVPVEIADVMLRNLSSEEDMIGLPPKVQVREQP